MSWLWLLAAIASEITGTLGLRASEGLRRRRWLAPVAAGYLAAFAFLSLALRAGMSVAVAYGVWTAVGIAAVALLARVIWRDPLTRRMLLGIAVIAAGVLLVELG
ncbi:DMT family transporter [Actinomadura parmotrematis]|uniref:Multidrug efflux SMR transporter n=1 Tax=Actinomadura parmotrematis TaxID=2864039 RepID=A0ABS7FQT2_9ACTN|nr:multidrug efflux SMR transporter [Actinomadura parmotrematis]MBW8482716.1 multidrug efflux SMR transporter [Actinomadura parmotrematis]